VSYRPDARHTKASFVRTKWISVRTLVCIEKLLFQLASVQTTQQPVRTTLSDRASDFLSKRKYGKIAATVRTTWIPVRTRYSLRQVRNSDSTVRTSVCHGPDVRSTDMEIACRRSTVRTAIPHGPDVRSLSKETSCNGRATVRTTVPHRPDAALKQDRFSAKISKFWSHSCPSRRPMSTVRTGPNFIKPDAHLSPQPINRGPCA
jgi:hypothetical protein